MVRLVACLTLAAWRLSCRRLGGRVVEGFTPLLPRFLGETAPLYVCRPDRFGHVSPVRSRLSYSDRDRLVARVMMDYHARNELEPRAFLPVTRVLFTSADMLNASSSISIEPVPNRTLSLFALPHE